MWGWDQGSSTELSVQVEEKPVCLKLFQLICVLGTRDKRAHNYLNDSVIAVTSVLPWNVAHGFKRIDSHWSVLDNIILHPLWRWLSHLTGSLLNECSSIWQRSKQEDWHLNIRRAASRLCFTTCFLHGLQHGATAFPYLYSLRCLFAPPLLAAINLSYLLHCFLRQWVWWSEATL